MITKNHNSQRSRRKTCHSPPSVQPMAIKATANSGNKTKRSSNNSASTVRHKAQQSLTRGSNVIADAPLIYDQPPGGQLLGQLTVVADYTDANAIAVE